MLSISTVSNLVVAAALIPNAYGESLNPKTCQATRNIPPPYCFVEIGVNYVGNDIGSVHGQVNDCCDKCLANANCNAWSWSNHHGGTCWLKSLKGQAVSEEGMTSAEVFQDSQCNIQPNTDIVGHDLRSVPSNNPQNCCDMCRIRQQCKAYVWSNANGGTCFLKRQRGTKISKVGVYAGTY